jgi:hypothetical protein
MKKPKPEKGPKIIKSKRSPYVRHEGKIYVEARYSGISVLVVMVSGLAISTFGKSATPYLLLDDAIRWHEKEIEVTNGKYPDTGLKVLTEAKNRILSENEKPKEEEGR